MNRYLITVVVPFLFWVSGCATPAPSTSKLIQINDEQWVDVGDVKEMLFMRNPAEAISNGSAPFEIALWHRGAADNPFRFTFTEEKTAYESWKRLTAKLGGTMHEDEWRPSLAAAQKPAGKSEDELFIPLRRDLDELKSCLDDGLIYKEEYDRGRAATTAALSSNVSSGQSVINGQNISYSRYGRLHEHLSNLKTLAVIHQITPQDHDALRAVIMAQYGLSPPEKPN